MVIAEINFEVCLELDDDSEVDDVISELFDKIVMQRGVVLTSTTGPVAKRYINDRSGD